MKKKVSARPERTTASIAGPIPAYQTAMAMAIKNSGSATLRKWKRSRRSDPPSATETETTARPQRSTEERAICNTRFDRAILRLALDSLRAGFRNRPSEEKDHTAEA